MDGRAARFLSMLLFLTLYATSGWGAGSFPLTPAQQERAGTLFSEVSTPIAFTESSDLWVQNGGFHLVTYRANSAGKELGEATRVLSLMPKTGPGSVDVVARMGDGGRVLGIVSLDDGEEGRSLYPLLVFLNDRDPKELQSPLTMLLNGLAAASGSVAKSHEPARIYPLEVKQKLLAPGDRLPAVKLTDVSGAPLDTADFADKQLVISFTAEQCIRCPEMTRALERVAGRVATVGIHAADPETSRAYGAELKGMVTVADPAGQLARLFLVPYSPYLMVSAKGVVTYSGPWEGEGRLLSLLSPKVEGQPQQKPAAVQKKPVQKKKGGRQ